jgi:hypothetical protein
MALATKAAMTAMAEAIRNETLNRGITKEEVADLFEAIIDSYTYANGKDAMVIIDFIYNASDGLYPHGINGTGASNTIVKGNIVRIGTASSEDGNGDIKFQIGFKCLALVDNPTDSDADWDIMRG